MTTVNWADQVGNTPLVPFHKLFKNDKGIEVFVKLEYLNPSGSIKDRIVKYILDDAETRGLLHPNATIVEATTGNTGAAIAYQAVRRGYKVILTTMDKVSAEKQSFMRMLGAELVVCPTDAGHGDPENYASKAKQLAAEIPGAFLLNQYDNPLNTEAHYKGTGPEIWQQMHGEIDWFVTNGSTGGTISGVGKYLKEQNASTKVLMADPQGSGYYWHFKTGAIDPSKIHQYQVEGVGEDHITACMDFSVVDDAAQFNDAEAFDWCRRSAKLEGILPGLSAGGNLAVVAGLIEKLNGPARIVTIIQDSGIKYLSKLLK